AQLLAGGDAVLFTVARGVVATGSPRLASPLPATLAEWDRAQIVVQSLKNGQRHTIVNGGSGASYLSSGHLLYAIGGVLFAATFDAQRLQLTGAAFPVVEGVLRN